MCYRVYSLCLIRFRGASANVPSVRASHMRVASARVLSTDAVAAAAAAAPRSICGHNEGCGIWGPEAPRSALSYDWLLPGVENGGSCGGLSNPFSRAPYPVYSSRQTGSLPRDSGRVSYFRRYRVRNETRVVSVHLPHAHSLIRRSLRINSFINVFKILSSIFQKI